MSIVSHHISRNQVVNIYKLSYDHLDRNDKRGFEIKGPLEEMTYQKIQEALVFFVRMNYNLREKELHAHTTDGNAKYAAREREAENQLNSLEIKIKHLAYEIYDDKDFEKLPYAKA